MAYGLCTEIESHRVVLPRQIGTFVVHCQSTNEMLISYNGDENYLENIYKAESQMELSLYTPSANAEQTPFRSSDSISGRRQPILVELESSL